MCIVYLLMSTTLPRIMSEGAKLSTCLARLGRFDGRVRDVYGITHHGPCLFCGDHAPKIGKGLAWSVSTN